MKTQTSNSDIKSKRGWWIRLAVIALASGALLGLSGCYHHHGYHGGGHGYHGGGHGYHHGGGGHGSYYGGRGGGGYCY